MDNALKKVLSTICVTYEESRELLEKTDDYDDFERRHKAFHMALLSACGRPRLLALCSSLFDQAERYRRLHFVKRSVSPEGLAEHEEMLNAALDRDAKKATRLVKDHINKTAQRVLEVSAADAA